MNQKLVHIALLVDDYDKAINYYTTKLNFRLVEDTPVNEAKRVLPVRIQQIDETDKRLFEETIGGVLRFLNFIYKEPRRESPA